MTPTAAVLYPPIRAIDRLASRIAKRTVDVIGASVGLLFAFPFAFVFGLIHSSQSHGPVFYRQKRIGKEGREFFILKIRSMDLFAEKDGPQWADENDPRCTPLGSFMRRLNIDEIPQFWNVLKGEMSLVGPRPERRIYVSDFIKEIPNYNARHSCLPGMSGWAQVNGWRGNTCVATRAKFDLWYIENWSLALDLHVIFKTLIAYRNAW